MSSNTLINSQPKQENKSIKHIKEKDEQMISLFGYTKI